MGRKKLAKKKKRHYWKRPISGTTVLCDDVLDIIFRYAIDSWDNLIRVSKQFFTIMKQILNGEHECPHRLKCNNSVLYYFSAMVKSCSRFAYVDRLVDLSNVSMLCIHGEIPEDLRLDKRQIKELHIHRGKEDCLNFREFPNLKRLVITDQELLSIDIYHKLDVFAMKKCKYSHYILSNIRASKILINGKKYNNSWI